VEADLGIICACLPALDPLIRFVAPRLGLNTESKTPNHTSGSSGSKKPQQRFWPSANRNSSIFGSDSMNDVERLVDESVALHKAQSALRRDDHAALMGYRAGSLKMGSFKHEAGLGRRDPEFSLEPVHAVAL